MTTDLIAARLKHVRDSAPCVGCGATLAACMANRGKDPTAPPWFGCCARLLLADERCHHVPSPSALSVLLDEIESGTVRTVEEVTPKPRTNGMRWSDYLDQGEKWRPNGKPMVDIADMDPEWRYNSSRWLERNAKTIALKYTLDEQIWFAIQCASPIGPSESTADMIGRELAADASARAGDPHAWIQGTALYRALVVDLPESSIALDAIADRAKHWSTCPARTGSGDCACEQIRAQCERCRTGQICQICEERGCGSCPDCSPEVPE